MYEAYQTVTSGIEGIKRKVAIKSIKGDTLTDHYSEALQREVRVTIVPRKPKRADAGCGCSRVHRCTS